MTTRPVHVAKIKQNSPLHHNIPCLFQVAIMKWFILWSQLNFIRLNIWMLITTMTVFWITAQENVGDVTMITFRNPESIQIVYTINDQIKMYTRRKKNYERVG